MDKIVFFQGAFDLLNVGHVRCFKKAKALGGYLIVAINTDRLMKEYKGEAIMPYKERREILESIKFIDKIIAIDNFHCLNLLKTFKVKVYIQTKEWESTHQEEINYMKSSGGKTVFLPRSKNVLSSSDIRKKCKLR